MNVHLIIIIIVIVIIILIIIILIIIILIIMMMMMMMMMILIPILILINKLLPHSRWHECASNRHLNGNTIDIRPQPIESTQAFKRSYKSRFRGVIKPV